jgi:hypothetical protein
MTSFTSEFATPLSRDELDQVADILNAPDVRPFLGGEGDLDPIDTTHKRRVYLRDGALFLFTQFGASAILHSAVKPESRGRVAHSLASEAALDVFTCTGCTEIVTWHKDDQPHARPPKSFGFRRWFSAPKRIDGDDGTWWRLDVADWIARSKACRKEGERVHSAIHAAGELDHEDDPVHDAFVGFVGLCAQRGRLSQGVSVYNYWAALAGYQQVAAVGSNTVQWDGATVSLRPDNYEVQSCL